jgi:transglutaminase superfamily protein
LLLLCDCEWVEEFQVKAIIQSSQTFWSLKSDDRYIASAAAIGLTATWLGLRVFGFRRWKGLVAKRAARPGAPAKQESSGISAKRIVQLEAAAARNLFFKTNCLEQSLALWLLLRRHGFPAELKIGARKDAGRFEAHAWIALDGCALNDESDEHREFVPFDGTLTAMERRAE